MVKILDGKKLSEVIAGELALKISKLKVKPVLAIIQIGNDPGSNSYISRKKSYGEKIGAKVHHFALPNNVSNNSLIKFIKELNDRKDIHGIIVQLPIPKTLNKYEIMEAIDHRKDVDGLNSKNTNILYESPFENSDAKKNPKGLVPATAKGIITLLKKNNISLVGKKVLIVGRSVLVGKPTAMLFIAEDSTVTVAHTKTKDLAKLAKESDIIVSAAGKAGLINKNFFRKGQVIIDVGTNSVSGPKTIEESSKIKMVGDVDFEAAKKIVSAISPVPGGVGPMTVASLFENLFEAYNLQK
ncbi:MAG: bifunctional 5,10-methylenetetrahydrofolate dehydrogenase/5,10-methenyltetrahydrofolate cyclohydrolase [Candidatus Paceibacterota bacterium]